jgi:hypothetical protein
LGSGERATFSESLAVEGEGDSGLRIVRDTAALTGEPEGDVVAGRRELERLPGSPQQRARGGAGKVGRATAAQDADKARHQ